MVTVPGLDPRSLDALNTAVLVIRDDQILTANSAAQRLFGRPEAELLGQSPVALSPPFQRNGRRSAELVHDLVAGAMAGEALDFDWLHELPNGDPIDCRVYLRHLPHAPDHLLAEVRDVTPDARARRALQASDALYQAMMEAISDAVLLTDLAGRFTYVCPNSEQLFGQSPTQIAHLGHIDRLLGPIAATRGPLSAEVTNHPHTITRPDGEARSLLINIKPVTIGAPRILYSCRDITTRRNVEAQLEHTLVGTIEALARTVQIRDPYTSGHQLRVAQLAEAIGQSLGFEPQRLQGLVLGATIHDLGKMYIPLDFLNRPGPLNEMEFALVRQHCAIGAELLDPVTFPWPLQAIVAQHHERMDGSGYPHGLKGDQILLEARIVAVADVVEAMSSHRPYRPALGTYAALAELRRGRGILFDPTVVDTCLDLFADGFTWDRPSRLLAPVRRPVPHAAQTS